MRRTFAGVAAALALLGATATAAAATNTYDGEITDDAKATVELHVEVRGERRVVTEFVVKRFPLECEGGTVARLQRARLAGRARVSRKGRFELEASNADQRLGIRGQLDGAEMRGRVNYSGRTAFVDETLECQADGLRWTATRQGGA
jgi:hypothetical protein